MSHRILLERDFSASRPLEKLVTDITYLPFGQSMMSLSSILDVFNGEIVAQTIGFNQDIDFVLDTLSQLPELLEEFILHSDQGYVYTSYAYQKAVKEKGITMRMSLKGTPTDNSTIETFHSCLKNVSQCHLQYGFFRLHVKRRSCFMYSHTFCS